MKSNLVEEKKLKVKWIEALKKDVARGGTPEWLTERRAKLDTLQAELGVIDVELLRIEQAEKLAILEAKKRKMLKNQRYQANRLKRKIENQKRSK